MITHRDHVMPKVEEFFNSIDVETVLELGAGNKTDFKNKFNLNWTCTDKSNNTLMEALPYEDNTFDVIFACHSFEHCENPVKALKEMQRVTKKYIFLITPCHCEHHILKSDEDHIFVLTDIQMERLFRYTKIKKQEIYLYKVSQNEQYQHLISIGRK